VAEGLAQRPVSQPAQRAGAVGRGQRLGVLHRLGDGREADLSPVSHFPGVDHRSTIFFTTETRRHGEDGRNSTAEN
jgi:hypothetical protein